MDPICGIGSYDRGNAIDRDEGPGPDTARQIGLMVNLLLFDTFPVIVVSK